MALHLPGNLANLKVPQISLLSLGRELIKGKVVKFYNTLNATKIQNTENAKYEKYKMRKYKIRNIQNVKFTEYEKHK